MSINRRKFLQLFVATTIAISTDSKALALDTSTSETAIQVAPPVAMTADTQFLWIMAQKFYDFAVFMATQYQVPLKYLFRSDLSVQTYYDSLLREYKQNENKPPMTLIDHQLAYIYNKGDSNESRNTRA